MATDDWLRVLSEAADLGVRMVQFIGGEPTLHSDLPLLVNAALDRDLLVEVFSNLVHVTPKHWEAFSRPGVRLATSYYSDDADEHAAIVGRPSAHRRTTANIAEAVRRGIPIRTGVIDVRDGQRSQQAIGSLKRLNVTDIGLDHLRPVGRGGFGSPPDVDALCGRCATGTAAISPDGVVWPCVFARWLPLGSVKAVGLAQILSGSEARRVRDELGEAFTQRAGKTKEPCDPQCGPACGPACNPQCWPTGTGPCRPKGGCQPNYD